MKSLFWGTVFCVFILAFGSIAQAIELPRIDGKYHKALVLIFLSTRCPNSKAHIEEIKKLAKINSGFKFLGIHSNADETEAKSKEYFKNLALPFEVLEDNDQALADRLKALKTPHAFVLSPQESILYQGGITDSQDPSSAKRFFLQDALNDIKTGRSVKTPEGRTLGCTIARKKESQNVW